MKSLWQHAVWVENDQDVKTLQELATTEGIEAKQHIFLLPAVLKDRGLPVLTPVGVKQYVRKQLLVLIGRTPVWKPPADDNGGVFRVLRQHSDRNLNAYALDVQPCLVGGKRGKWLALPDESMQRFEEGASSHDSVSDASDEECDDDDFDYHKLWAFVYSARVPLSDLNIGTELIRYNPANLQKVLDEGYVAPADIPPAAEVVDLPQADIWSVDSPVDDERPDDSGDGEGPIEESKKRKRGDDIADCEHDHAPHSYSPASDVQDEEQDENMDEDDGGSISTISTRWTAPAAANLCHEFNDCPHAILAQLTVLKDAEQALLIRLKAAISK